MSKRSKPGSAAASPAARPARNESALQRERARLEEEVRQLRAAVKLYAEVVRRSIRTGGAN